MTTDLQALKSTAQATAEKSPELLVTVPAGVMVELIADVERYRWLRDQKPNALHLERNADNSCNYRTVEEWINDNPEWFKGTPEDALRKMAETDTHWQLQVYPDTPIGFVVYSRASLDELIDSVMSEGSE